MKKPSKNKILFVVVLPIASMCCLLAFGAGVYSFLIAFLMIYVGEAIIAIQNKRTTDVL